MSPDTRIPPDAPRSITPTHSPTCPVCNTRIPNTHVREGEHLTRCRAKRRATDGTHSRCDAPLYLFGFPTGRVITTAIPAALYAEMLRPKIVPMRRQSRPGPRHRHPEGQDDEAPDAAA